MATRLRLSNIGVLAKDLSLTPEERQILERYLSASKTRAFLKPADIFRKRGYLDESIEILEEGLTHYPDFNAGRVLLTQDLLAKGEVRRAKMNLEPIMGELIDNPIALKVMLKISILEGDENLSKKYFDDLHNIFSFDEDVGFLYEKFVAGGVTKAKKSLIEEFHRKGVTIFPATGGSLQIQDSQKAYYDEYSVVNARDVFTNWIRSVQDIDDDPMENDNLESLTVAELHIQQGEYEKALKIYQDQQLRNDTEKISTRITQIHQMIEGVDPTPDEDLLTREQTAHLKDNKVSFLNQLLNRIENRS